MNRIDLLKSMLAEDANDPFLHYALGLELAKTEDAAAAQQFAALSLSHPEYLATYYQWGQCLEAIGKLQDARNAYQKGLTLAQSQGERKTAAELQEALWGVEDALED